jgi:hypothetical protein
MSDLWARPSVRLALGGSDRTMARQFPDPRNQFKALNRSGSFRLASPRVPLDRMEARLEKTVPLPPALLVSYVYLPGFLKNRHRYHYRDWVLDSGAFSAHNSGKEIKLQDYIDTCKKMLAEDQTLTEVFALDVIGDHKASLRNTEEMWRQGVPAIPTFHRGSPWPELKAIAADYPKVALGGVAMLRGDQKLEFAKQAFNLIWPKKIHGLGYGAEQHVMALPWHSVDATSWELGPCRFGRWKHFGALSVRGSNQNLRKEVEWYLELERKAQFRWRREMELLHELDGQVTGQLRDRSRMFCRPIVNKPDSVLRFALSPIDREGGATGAANIAKALSPDVRLACSTLQTDGGNWGFDFTENAIGKEGLEPRMPLKQAKRLQRENNGSTGQ